MIRYKDQQRPADHDEALRILRRLEQRRPRDIERAKDLFSTFVDPAINYMPNPTSAQVNAVNCSFTEWCFYDFVLEPDPSGTPFAGTTVLEDAAAEDPSLKQLADTQFFSSFWVIEQDPASSGRRAPSTRACRSRTGSGRPAAAASRTTST